MSICVYKNFSWDLCLINVLSKHKIPFPRNARESKGNCVAEPPEGIKAESYDNTASVATIIQLES